MRLLGLFVKVKDILFSVRSIINRFDIEVEREEEFWEKKLFKIVTE